MCKPCDLAFCEIMKEISKIGDPHTVDLLTLCLQLNFITLRFLIIEKIQLLYKLSATQLYTFSGIQVKYF